MACILCRLICGPNSVAATERWIRMPWNKPNNESSFWRSEPNPPALRTAIDMWKTDREAAFQMFSTLAEKGSVISMCQLGVALLSGWGTPVDKVKAERWLRQSIEAGNERAVFTLGNAYIRQERYAEAEALLLTYDEKGNPPALYLLGFVYLKLGNKAKARGMWEQASAAGHGHAKAHLAKSAVLGRFGITLIPYGFRLCKEVSDIIKNNELEAARGVAASVDVVTQPDVRNGA